jgi:hypothetical protein
MAINPKKIKEYKILIYEGEEDIIAKIDKFGKLFSQKADNKTIKKMIVEFEITK